jgi:hypothetical protein
VLALALVVQRSGRAGRRWLAARWRAPCGAGRPAQHYLPERPSVDA